MADRSVLLLPSSPFTTKGGTEYTADAHGLAWVPAKDVAEIMNAGASSVEDGREPGDVEKESKDQAAVRTEAKKLDDEAKKANEKADHDRAVARARTVFAPDEKQPDGTPARRLAHPGEVTDAAGEPNPWGDHVNLGTALEPEVVPIGGLAPTTVRNLGLPTGQGGGRSFGVGRGAATSGFDRPPAPDDVRGAPIAREPAKA